jgi:hypothetical protein
MKDLEYLKDLKISTRHTLFEARKLINLARFNLANYEGLSDNPEMKDFLRRIEDLKTQCFLIEKELPFELPSE